MYDDFRAWVKLQHAMAAQKKKVWPKAAKYTWKAPENTIYHILMDVNRKYH